MRAIFTFTAALLGLLCAPVSAAGPGTSAATFLNLGSSAPGLAEFYGMFMGVGFRTKYGNMDYTLLPYGELGNAHRFSFSLRFGAPKADAGVGVFK